MSQWRFERIMIELKKENKQATHKPRFIYGSNEGKKVRIIQPVESEQQHHTKKKRAHGERTPSLKNAWPLV